jgi:hypothetical protein
VLLAHSGAFDLLRNGAAAPVIVASWRTELEQFRERAEKYFLY